MLDENKNGETMKTFITAILIAILFSGCCPEITEVQRTTTTQRDTTITPPPVEGGGEDQDPEFWNALYGELNRLYSENDSLRGLKPDTVKVTEYLKSKPFVGKWEIFKVTPSGDSVWITFRLKNATGEFDYKVVAAPIKATLTDTETTKIQEKQPTWWDNIRAYFKYIIVALLSLAIGFGGGFLFGKFRLRLQ